MNSSQSDLVSQFERGEVEALKELHNSFSQNFQELKKNGNLKKLYHYTNEAALVGILESGQIWLSDVFQMNDTSEIRHGLKYAREALVSAGLSDSKLKNHLIMKFDEFCESGIQTIGTFLVACFSTSKNDLSQWRAYADDGRGYSIEFEAFEFMNQYSYVENSPGVESQSFLVTYDDDRLKNCQLKIISRARQLIECLNNWNGNQDDMYKFAIKLMEVFTMSAITISLYFKHPAYKSENEFRIVQILSSSAKNDLYFERVRNSKYIRYRKFDWRGKVHISEIMIGPTDFNQNKWELVSECIKRNSLKRIFKAFSGIPYRGTSS